MVSTFLSFRRFLDRHTSFLPLPFYAVGTAFWFCLAYLAFTKQRIGGFPCFVAFVHLLRDDGTMERRYESGEGDWIGEWS